MTVTRTIEGRLLMADFKEHGTQCRVHPPTGEPILCRFSEDQKDEVLANILALVRIVGEATKPSASGRMLIDRIHYIERIEQTATGSSKLPSEEARRRTLEHRLWSAFEEAPLEDGIGHRAEVIIDDAIRTTHPRQLSAWLSATIWDEENSDFAASLLRCLGRTTPGTAEWRVRIVHQALASKDIGIRDAGVQAAESWGGRQMRKTLQAHSEPEGWLREYIHDVVEDLGD